MLGVCRIEVDDGTDKGHSTTYNLKLTPGVFDMGMRLNTYLGTYM
jgi:hypothetical protein